MRSEPQTASSGVRGTHGVGGRGPEPALRCSRRRRVLFLASRQIILVTVGGVASPLPRAPQAPSLSLSPEGPPSLAALYEALSAPRLPPCHGSCNQRLGKYTASKPPPEEGWDQLGMRDKSCQLPNPCWSPWSWGLGWWGQGCDSREGSGQGTEKGRVLSFCFTPSCTSLCQGMEMGLLFPISVLLCPPGFLPQDSHPHSPGMWLTSRAQGFMAQGRLGAEQEAR